MGLSDFEAARPKGFDIVTRAPQYNKHPSGVECIEIAEHMTFNLGNAFKYGWRYLDKGDPVENLKKMRWYVQRSLACDSTHYLLISPNAIHDFRLIMDERRRRAFMRPSPWCEPVRHSLAAIADLHATTVKAEHLRLYDKTLKCVETAIADEQCLGRQLEG